MRSPRTQALSPRLLSNWSGVWRSTRSSESTLTTLMVTRVRTTDQVSAEPQLTRMDSSSPAFLRPCSLLTPDCSRKEETEDAVAGSLCLKSLQQL